MGDVLSSCAPPTDANLSESRKRGAYLLTDHYDHHGGTSPPPGQQGLSLSGTSPNPEKAKAPYTASTYSGSTSMLGGSTAPYATSNAPYATDELKERKTPYTAPTDKGSTSTYGGSPPHTTNNAPYATSDAPYTKAVPASTTAQESTTSVLGKFLGGGSGSGRGEWDAETFLKQLQDARASGNKHLEKKVLAQVAESNYALKNKWKIPVTIGITADRCARTRVQGKAKDPDVSFSTLTTADAILALAENRSRRICALNFANGQQIGGGYKTGATAQEEDLCRRIPALYTTLYNGSRAGLYPFGPCTLVSLSSPGKYSDVLFTSGLAVARASEVLGYRLLQPCEEASVSLITAAAPNINFAKEVSNADLMYNTVKAIFVAPLLEEPALNTLILGAWGCGAFGGNPDQISELFARAFKENLGRLWDEVHFAIPPGPNSDAFRRTFQKYQIRYSEI